MVKYVRSKESFTDRTNATLTKNKTYAVEREEGPLYHVKDDNGRLCGFFKCRFVEDVIAEIAYDLLTEDPSAKRDREHKPVPLPAMTPFNHFPDLEGWQMEVQWYDDKDGTPTVGCVENL